MYLRLFLARGFQRSIMCFAGEDRRRWRQPVPPSRVTAGRASSLLGRSGPSAGLVISRQKFVR